MSGACTSLAAVVVLGLVVPAFAGSEFTNSMEDRIADKNAGLSGNVNIPPETAIDGDVIGSAIPIPALPYTNSANTCGFTNDYDEVCPYTGSTSPDIVYSYSPESNQWVTLDLCNSGYDTKIYVYENAAGFLVACNDDACNDPFGNPFRSLVTCLYLEAGNTYYIVIDGYLGDCGTYNLSASVIAPCVPSCNPANWPPCNVSEGEPICGPNYVDTFDGGCNSIPNVFREVSYNSVICGTSGTYSFNGLSYRDTDWYVFNVPVAYNATVILCASFDAELAVIDGNDGCGLKTILCGPLFAPAGFRLFCEYVAPSGPNWIFAATSAFTGVACGSPYTLLVCYGSDCFAATESKSWGGIKALYR